MERRFGYFTGTSGIYEYIGLFIGILICYSSVFVRHYGLSDDYSVIYYHYVSPGWHVQWESMSGRPVYGALRQIMTWTVGKVATFSVFRFVSVLFMALYSVIFLRYLDKKDIFKSGLMRFCVAWSLAFLPAMQIYASWAMTYPFILAVILAFCASVCLDEADGVRNSVISYGMLVVSFLIYQPAAMMFVFFSFLKVFFEEGYTVRKVIRSGAILFFAMLTNFVFIKIYTFLYGSTGRETLDVHVVHEILWFFRRPFVQSIENYNIHSSVFYAGVSVCLILIGIGFSPVKWNFFVKNMMVAGFCLASYAPNIVVTEVSSPYRTLVGVESILAVLFLNGLFHLLSRFRAGYKSISCFVMASVALSAIFNINHYIIDVQQHQMSDLAAAFKSIPAGQTIDFDIRGVDKSYYSDFSRYEYGTISIGNEWTPKAMAMDIIRNNGLKDIRVTDGILVSSPGRKDVYYVKMSEIRTLKY